ncbi:Arc family DNA-binding protein [Acinetobacter baumannii]|uniref:Arc family DNA-binding protein n=1 Tax=Acinetobacter pittii TaxID=48296 RepID=UPI001980148C|nr:Arc family DNA-binding protein [Acinetobacter pittii]MBN6523322.1 Arc family DNA-binding protein [Acinetobacter pittii]MCH2072985.1 Arc family DNA-binding protein [Acinetobacter pittii]
MARTDPQFNLRVPQELKQQVEDAAKESGRSINAEAVHRLEESFLRATNSSSQADVKIIPLKDGKKRVIYGKLLNTLDLDYTQELSSLRDDIHLSLEVLSNSSFWNSLKFFNKDVLVYKGNNHIDIVDNGKKSLGWLIVEDHYVHPSKKTEEN